MALFKILENFLWDIFAIPVPSAGGNFTENSVFRNKQYVELAYNSQGHLNYLKDNVFIWMLIPMVISTPMTMPNCWYCNFHAVLRQCSFVSRSHFFTKIHKLFQTCEIKITRNIVFRVNRKIKMSRNTPKIYLQSRKIMMSQNFRAIKQNMKYIPIYNFRRCRNHAFFLFHHFLTSRRKIENSWA